MKRRLAALLIGVATICSGCKQEPEPWPRADASLRELLVPIASSVSNVCPPATDEFCRTLIADVGSFRRAFEPTGVHIDRETLGRDMGFDIVDVPIRDAYECVDDRPLYACTPRDPRTHVSVVSHRRRGSRLVVEVLVHWAAGPGPHDRGGFHMNRHIYSVRDGRWVFEETEGGIIT